jgi:hypothetical protein
MMDFKHIPAEELDSSPGREMLGFVDELEGGIAKAEVATHDLGPEDVERKIKTQLAGEGESQRPSMDFKHIPAEELDEGLLDRKRPGMPVEGEAEHVDHWSSEVALDRKGGDKPVGDEMGAEIALDRKGDDKPVGDEMGAEIALDRKGDDKPIPDEGGDEVALDRKGDDGPALDGKQGDLTPDQKVLDSDPGAEVGKISGPNPKGDRVSDIEASGPDFKVEIDPVEPDFKFLKSEPGAEVASGFRDKFEGLDNSSGYENLEPILGRLVTDEAFRQQLARDPHSVLGEYELSEEEIHLINQMPRDQLEQMAAEVQARFADTADAAIQEAQANLLAELLWGSEKDKFDTGSATHKDSWKGE